MLHLSFTSARLERVRSFAAKQLGVLAFVIAGAVISSALFQYPWYMVAAGAAVWAVIETAAALVILAGHDPPS